MDPNGPIARRFPLVSRIRPVCLPLPARVGKLEELADTAEQVAYQGMASSVFNQVDQVTQSTAKGCQQFLWVSMS